MRFLKAVGVGFGIGFLILCAMLAVLVWVVYVGNYPVQTLSVTILVICVSIALLNEYC